MRWCWGAYGAYGAYDARRTKEIGMSYLERARRAGRKAGCIKGGAVELWRAGDRYFLVADDFDALALLAQGEAKRGEIWTAAEVEVVARINDQQMRDEVERWKRATNSRIRRGVIDLNAKD